MAGAVVAAGSGVSSTGVSASASAAVIAGGGVSGLRGLYFCPRRRSWAPLFQPTSQLAGSLFSRLATAVIACRDCAIERFATQQLKYLYCARRASRMHAI